MATLGDMFTDAFGVTLYTNDGRYEEDDINGHVHRVLCEVDVSSVAQMFEAREEYVTNPTCLGPLLDVILSSNEAKSMLLDFKDSLTSCSSSFNRQNSC
jgi:hypothetical protein